MESIGKQWKAMESKKKSIGNHVKAMESNKTIKSNDKLRKSRNIKKKPYQYMKNKENQGIAMKRKDKQ